MIAFTMNGKKIKGQKGWTVLDAARWHGIDIPTLCYHPGIEAYGACRLCVVEVTEGKRSRVVISCMYPIKKGLNVKTDTPRVNNVRRWIVQLLLDESPGSPQIQALAQRFGVTPSRFKKTGVEFACHLCGLCVRACHEVVGTQALTFGNRGLKREITSPFHVGSTECISCGTCLYVCPTGAMERMYDQIRAV